jgi:hypothetical protein
MESQFMATNDLFNDDLFYFCEAHPLRWPILSRHWSVPFVSQGALQNTLMCDIWNQDGKKYLDAGIDG